ncbi:hypothetical protein FB565_000504 [Actinoplanes lutulentus]|nr:hypothetical protein [Actinoplanes lutulentus]MBB2940800.1 hypothetical protein [Actinoplanes lutulentus]
MEILPGLGTPLVQIGESREVVECKLGTPVHPGRLDRAVYQTSPMLVLSYTDIDTVEIVEIAYSGDGGEEAWFDGVQLTYRFLDDVVADLAARGHRGEQIDIGYRFEPGFALFSVGSRSPRDLDPAADEDDPRRICEGVLVAPFDYFDAPDEEEVEQYIRDRIEAAGLSGPEADELRDFLKQSFGG